MHCFVALVYKSYFFQNSRFTEIIRHQILIQTLLIGCNFSYVCLVLVKMASKTVTIKVYHDHPTRFSVAHFSGFFFSFYIFRRTLSPFQLFRQQYQFRYRNFHHFLTLWWARNNFGLIFLLCVHGFLSVHISRSCRLRWPKGLYLKFHFSKAV